MATYTIKNLKEFEDVAEKAGLSPDFEARFGRQELEAEHTGISYQRLAPNTRGPFGHSHGEDEEIYVVLSGSGAMKLDDEVIEIRALDTIRVAPQTVRAFAAGPDGIEYLAFGTHTDDDASTRQVDWP